MMKSRKNIELNVMPSVGKLVKDQPEFFKSPSTLIVMLDTRACGGNLKEAQWWSEWQRHMSDQGYGFVFVTSKMDSADVAIAAQMEGVDAPVIVMTEVGRYISDLWAPAQSIPIKLLVDSKTGVKSAWLWSVRDRNTSDHLLSNIDFLTNSK